MQEQFRSPSDISSIPDLHTSFAFEAYGQQSYQSHAPLASNALNSNAGDFLPPAIFDADSGGIYFGPDADVVEDDIPDDV